MWAWRCELQGCGHTWLATGIDPPQKCAKCKKRGWHKKDIVHSSNATQAHWQTNRNLDLPGIERQSTKPDMQALRDICAGKFATPLKHFEATLEIRDGISHPLVEIPICGHKWWEQGEFGGENTQYECLMDKGHKNPLHGRAGMVRRIEE